MITIGKMIGVEFIGAAQRYKMKNIELRINDRYSYFSNTESEKMNHMMYRSNMRYISGEAVVELVCGRIWTKIRYKNELLSMIVWRVV